MSNGSVVRELTNRHTQTDRQTGPILYPRPLTREGISHFYKDYVALMLIWDIPFYIFPIIALICNIIVVTGNSINFLRTKNININLLTPYLIGSVPFAFFGASISIDKDLFEILLFIF